MNYTTYAQYEEEEEREKGKRIKIPKKGSDYDNSRRYISRKGHREAYEQLAEEQAEYQPEPQPEPVKSRGFKKIKVSQYTPEAVSPKSIKIRTAKDSKSRYERRKGKGTELQPTEEAELVTDSKTIAKVEKARQTRSQELEEIEEKAYNKQNAIETKKQRERENTQAARRGELRGMNTFDRAVETVADYTAKPAEWKGRIEEAKNKIMHTPDGRQKVTSKVQKASGRAPKVSMKSIPSAKTIQKSYKAIQPKQRVPFATRSGAPFVVPKKTLPVSRPAGNPFISRKGNPLGSSARSGNPLGSPKKGNPFSIQKKQWRF